MARYVLCCICVLLCVELFELSWCCWSRFVVVVGMYWLYVFLASWVVSYLRDLFSCLVSCLVDVSLFVWLSLLAFWFSALKALERWGFQNTLLGFGTRSPRTDCVRARMRAVSYGYSIKGWLLGQEEKPTIWVPRFPQFDTYSTRSVRSRTNCLRIPFQRAQTLDVGQCTQVKETKLPVLPFQDETPGRQSVYSVSLLYPKDQISTKKGSRFYGKSHGAIWQEDQSFGPQLREFTFWVWTILVANKNSLDLDHPRDRK